MKMIFELFIKQKTWFKFVSFLTEQTLQKNIVKMSYLAQKRPNSWNLSTAKWAKWSPANWFVLIPQRRFAL